MAKITKRSLDAAKPKSKEYFIWDSSLTGFGVRITPKGTKTFVVYYRFEGRHRRLKLGRYGPLTPDEARDLAQRRLGEVAKGIDPMAIQQSERQAPTLAQFAVRFLREHCEPHLKPTTAREYRRLLEKQILPKFGSMKMASLQRADVAQIHAAMKDRPYQANRFITLIGTMFNVAQSWGVVAEGYNPTRHVKKYQEKGREVFLEPDEIKTVWKVLDQRVAEGLETPHVAAAFKLLLTTGCRLREIQTLKWSYIRRESIFLPDAKTGPRRVLLSPLALHVLTRVPRDPENPYVVCGAIRGQHVTDLQRPWRRIREAARVPHVRIHDLRHTYASLSAMTGHSLPMIGRLLGHSQAQTTARYAHLADDVTRKASDEVGALISDFIEETPISNPNQIPRAANDV